MIEPTQLVEMTIYSKLINEMSGIIINDRRIMFVIIALFLLYKHVPDKYYKHLFCEENKNESFIIIPSHKKVYHIGGFTTKEITKQKYSFRFKALHHFLLHNCQLDFPQLYEIMEVIDSCKEYSHTEQEEYILMPYQNQKVKICSKNDIYLELSVANDKNDDGDEKAKKTPQCYKQYLCKLTTPTNNIKIINDFLDKCIEEHKNYIKKNANKQYIFEYLKTEYDDSDRKVAKYVETHFTSNKHLTKNIFFPEKEAFITQLDKFVHEREKHQAEYAETGQTYKFATVLYGPPGTGKTCIVRGMLNYTGRDAIIVPWSNVKTCGDLSSILRSTKFNGKTKELKDLIYVFEDFDANYNKALKARKPKKKLHKYDNDAEPEDLTILANKMDTTANETNTPKEVLEQIKSLKEYATNAMNVMNKPMDDELTMEYVLNAFDGVVELHDAIIVFTTNHLEDIDPAVIRPGRIDYMLELKNATLETIKDMIKAKYKLSDGELAEYDDRLKQIEKKQISPALVQNMCYKYEKEEIVEKLIEYCK